MPNKKFVQKIYLCLFFISIFFCNSGQKNLKKVEHFFNIRQKAYTQLDVNLMMGTYHPEYTDKGENYQTKLDHFTRIFKPGSQYQFNVTIVSVAKEGKTLRVVYNYKIQKDMAMDSKRGYSHNFKNQEIYLSGHEGKLKEYGVH